MRRCLSPQVTVQRLSRGASSGWSEPELTKSTCCLEKLTGWLHWVPTGPAPLCLCKKVWAPRALTAELGKAPAIWEKILGWGDGVTLPTFKRVWSSSLAAPGLYLGSHWEDWRPD